MGAAAAAIEWSCLQIKFQQPESQFRNKRDFIDQKFTARKLERKKEMDQTPCAAAAAAV
jgi:hypothetical protein